MALVYDKWGNFKGYTSNGKGAWDYWYGGKYKLVPMNLKGIKDRKIKELSKERIIVECIIRPLEEERVIKERFIQYNTIENVLLRQEQFKLYYYGSKLSIKEVKEEELNRMLESYESFKESGAKAFYNWLKAYVVVDYGLLLEMVKLTSETKQQKYKKMKSIKKVFGNLAKVSKKLEKDDYLYDITNWYKDEEQYKEELLEARDSLSERHMYVINGFMESIKIDEKYKEIKYKSTLRSYHKRLEDEARRWEDYKRRDAEARM